jgi:cell division protein ZapD
VSTKLTFEHPLNERVRIFLRLEYLFKKVAYFQPQDSAWATRAAIEGLLDVASLTSRSDIKAELLKELDRNTATLERIRRQPGVDETTLDKVLEDLQLAANGLRARTGQVGQRMRNDAFLKSVTQRNAIPGGTCSFDLPQYHHWLTQPAEARHQHISGWMEDLQPVRSAIGLTLSLARTSATPREVRAREGFFHEALDVKAPAQLVRVTLDSTESLFPEISGHKNRFSIRFMQSKDLERPIQFRGDLDFILTCCVF